MGRKQFEAMFANGAFLSCSKLCYEVQMSGFYSELKRRNVIRVAIAYGLVAWVLLQIADVLFPALSLPDWTVRLVAGLLIIGFPLAVFFAWAFELTPEGLKREHEVDRERSITRTTGRKLDFVVIAVLVVAVALFALDKFVWEVDEPVTTSTVADKSIAVLPFLNMSADPENEYFSDGISEELLNLLARIPELRVIGRTSSFQFKGKQEDLRSIGETLGVANLLEGSVRKSGDRVRITAQLISAADGTHVWTESFDRTLDDIFEVQDEIALAVVEALRVELLGESIPVHSSPTVAGAYDAYLKGLFHYRRLNADDLATSLTYFEQALDLDPSMAAAWEKVGSVYINQTLSGTLPLLKGRKMSQDALDRAIELDPMAADAHYQSGFRRMAFDWDWSGTEASMNKALAIEPNHSGALSGLGLLNLAMGRTATAVEFQKQSLRADPLRLASHFNLGFIYYESGQTGLAAEAFKSILEYSPNLVRGHYRYALALLAQGNPTAALAEAELELGEQWRLAGLAMVYHALGRGEESDAALAELVKRFPDDAAAAIAKAYAFRGETEAALRWLDTAYEQHDPLVPWVRSDPMLANLQNDPKFAAFLERLNLPPNLSLH